MKIHMNFLQKTNEDRLHNKNYLVRLEKKICRYKFECKSIELLLVVKIFEKHKSEAAIYPIKYSSSAVHQQNV